MPVPPLISSSSLQGHDWWGAALRLVTLLVIVVNLAVYGGRDYEWISTKHWFDGFWYGGFGSALVASTQGLRYLYSEASGALISTFSFLDVANVSFSDSPHNNERLFANAFIPAILIKLSAGRLDAFAAIFLTNVLLWGGAIWSGRYLAFKWARSHHAGWWAAMIIASVPTMTLMFNSMKIQYSAGPVMLLALHAYERLRPRLDPVSAVMALTALWTILLLSTGAWLLFLIAFFFIHVLPRRVGWREVALMLGTFAAAKAIVGLVFSWYGLTPGLSHYNPGGIVLESLVFIKTWLTGGDVSSMKFMNYKGWYFFDYFIPSIFRGFFGANPILAVLGLVAFILVRETRLILVAGVLMLLPGHLGMVLTGYDFHYGFAHLPVTLAFSIATAALLSRLSERRGMVVRGVALAAATSIILVYMIDDRAQFDNYYGNVGQYLKSDNIYIYHGKHVQKF